MSTKHLHQIGPLEKTLIDLRDRAARVVSEAQAELAAAEHAITLARGTVDLTAHATTAVQGIETARVTLADRITAVLAGPEAPIGLEALATAVSSTSGRVATCVRELRAKKRVYNLGTEEHPAWHWIGGDDIEAPALYALVLKLIAFRPLLLAELVDCTGAGRNRISGILVRLQRDGYRVENHGEANRARWYLTPKKRARARA